MIHELKTWPQYFKDIECDNKTFEIRKNDRNFQIGDHLWLKEYDPDTQQYTGKVIYKEIGYILHGGNFGIDEEFVVMSLKSLNPWL